MTTTDTLAQRYGAPSPWRGRALISVVVVVVVAFGAWLAWSAFDHATPQVESELVGFEIVDEHQVSALVTITFRDPEVEATCLLRAFAEDHSVVGELSFQPAGAVNGQVSQTIRTERRATSVEKVGCTAEGQQRPR